MFGREHGARFGGGDLASDDLVRLQRKERARSLAAEIYDIKNDPYVMKNHIGGFECRLCSTPHPTEANYMVHTEGKRHRENLAKRMAQLNKNKPTAAGPIVERKKVEPRRTPKIGRPGYRVVKQLDREKGRHSLLFRVEYPRIEEGLRPRFRFMSSFEQRVEVASDKVQYLLVAAEPYEVIAFKLPNARIDTSPGAFLTHWDAEKTVFTIQFAFRDRLTPAERLIAPASAAGAGAGAGAGTGAGAGAGAGGMGEGYE